MTEETERCPAITPPRHDKSKISYTAPDTDAITIGIDLPVAAGSMSSTTDSKGDSVLIDDFDEEEA